MANIDDAIRAVSKESDYEELALQFLRAGGGLPSNEYKKALTAQAQVLATLHYARQTGRAIVVQAPPREPAPASHGDYIM